nr:MMPL family transporter [Actinomadura bangladeshensis]
MDGPATGALAVYVTGSSPLSARGRRIGGPRPGPRRVHRLPIALLVLIIAFGSLGAAGLPLLAGVAALVTAFGVLGTASKLTSFDVFVQAVFTMIGLALGLDYCLFTVTRQRADLAAHPGRAIADTGGATIATAGKAVLFSGSTVLISVAGLLLVRTPVFRTMAIGVMVAVAVMLAITLTLLPAVLALLGERINRLAVPGDAACGRWELRFALAALDGPGHAPPGAHRRRRDTGPAPGRRDPDPGGGDPAPAAPPPRTGPVSSAWPTG